MDEGFLGFLNHWWNVPYLVMLLLVALYFLLQLAGLAGHVHVDHDGDGLPDHHEWLGVGRVPFMVVWCTLFLFAGFTGLIVNRVIYLALGAPLWLFPASLGAALLAGFTGMRLFARAAARLVDTGGQGSSTKAQLVGKLGVVASAELDAKFGEVRVHDGAHEILVHGRLQQGDAPLVRGARVIVVDYDASSELYWIASSPDIG